MKNLRIAALALAAVGEGIGGAVMRPAPPEPAQDFDPRPQGRPYRARNNKRWHGEVLKKRAQRKARHAERRNRK